MEARLAIVAAVLGSAMLMAGAGAAAQAQPSPPAPDAARPAASTPTPDQIAAGEAVFKGGTCGACHGGEAKGGPLGPDLTAGAWIWSDGSLAGITDTIAKGVPAPKKFRSPMPPMGGLNLSPSDLANVAAYVWSVGHK